MIYKVFQIPSNFSENPQKLPKSNPKICDWLGIFWSECTCISKVKGPALGGIFGITLKDKSLPCVKNQALYGSNPIPPPP